MAPRKDATVSAHLIFSKEEYDSYLKFQRLTSPWQILGHIGSAVDYRAFKYYCSHRHSHSQQRSHFKNSVRTNEHHARKCGHPMHPAHGTVVKQEYCTVCKVSWMLEFLEVLTRAWDEYGGPWKAIDSASQGEENDALLAKRSSLGQAWRRAKIDLANEIDLLHEMAEKESSWETEHPDYQVVSHCSASRAIEIARRRMTDPTIYMAKVQFRAPDLCEDSGLVKSTKGKSVTFSQEAKYWDTISDTFKAAAAPLVAFVTGNQQQAGTGKIYDELYNVQQLKVYTVETQEEFQSIKKCHEPILDKFEGCSAHHVHWKDIQKAALNVQTAGQKRRWRDADSVVVQVVDGSVRKILPMCLENDVDALSIGRPSRTAWTPHSEFV